VRDKSYTTALVVAAAGRLYLTISVPTPKQNSGYMKKRIKIPEYLLNAERAGEIVMLEVPPTSLKLDESWCVTLSRDEAWRVVRQLRDLGPYPVVQHDYALSGEMFICAAITLGLKTIPVLATHLRPNENRDT
jgi:hypothetical protein